MDWFLYICCVAAAWGLWSTIPDHLRDIARELKRANDVVKMVTLI